MNRALLHSLVCVTLAAIGCKTGKPAELAEPADRAQPAGPTLVRVMPIRDTVIELGMPVPAGASMSPAGDSVVALAPKEFTGIDMVRAHLTTGGTVRALVIEYTFRTDFDAMVSERIATLGAPHREPFRTGQRVVWEDAKTRFELVHDPERSAGPVYGVLTDRTREQ